MCPGSLDAIQGALGTVCEAVDAVISSTGHHLKATPATPRRAFCVVRPPGHHCGEDTPCGFCFVNNVAVAAAHGESRSAPCHRLRPIDYIFEAHLKHKVRRVVIFDIDLHHGIVATALVDCPLIHEIGNGTQAIVWGINEECHRKTLESESLPPDQGSVGTELQIYYGSLHDILSFPCEVRWLCWLGRCRSYLTNSD